MYFDALVAGLISISENLANTHTQLLQQTECINFAYAERVLAWVENLEHDDITRKGNLDILDVKRDIGKVMTIYTNRPVSSCKSSEIIKQVLQEDVIFIEKRQNEYLTRGRK